MSAAITSRLPGWPCKCAEVLQTQYRETTKDYEDVQQGNKVDGCCCTRPKTHLGAGLFEPDGVRSEQQFPIKRSHKDDVIHPLIPHTQKAPLAVEQDWQQKAFKA